MTTETTGDLLGDQPAAIETQIAEYSPTAAALAELRQRVGSVVYDVTTTKGLDAAKRDRRELVTLRTSLEAKRKELKAPALERTRLIDAEAKRIESEIVALEEPIDKQIKAEEARREAEKQAKAEAERKRVAAIHAKIDEYRRAVADATGLNSEQVKARRLEIAATRSSPVWEIQFAEFALEAVSARDAAIIGLADLQDRVARQEAEAAQIEADRRELEELKRLQAEREAAEARARAEREAKERAEREAQERAEAQARAEREAEERRQREAAEAEARARREAEEKRLREEAERLAAERAAFECQQREAREAQEARERAERERLEALARQEQARQREEARREELAIMANAPEDEEIIAVLMAHFSVDRRHVIAWLQALDFSLAEREAVGVAA